MKMICDMTANDNTLQIALAQHTKFAVYVNHDVEVVNEDAAAELVAKFIFDSGDFYTDLHDELFSQLLDNRGGIGSRVTMDWCDEWTCLVWRKLERMDTEANITFQS